MALFDPWTLGQAGNGLFGGMLPSYSKEDVGALINGYPSQWVGLGGVSPGIPGDPSGSAPLGPQAWNSPLMPRGTTTLSTEPAITNPGANSPGQYAGGFPVSAQSGSSPDWSLLFTDPFGKRVPIPSLGEMIDRSQQPASAPSSAQTSPQPDLAQFSPQTGGFDGAPQMANVPLPRPRPEMAAIPPAAQPTVGTQPMAQGPVDVSSRNMNQAIAQPPSPEQQFNPLDRMQAAGAGFFNAGSPMQAIGNVIGGLATGQRQDKAGQAQANQQQTANAVAIGLMRQGYPQETAQAIARAAAIDPKVAEKLLGDAFANPKTMEELVARNSAQGARGASGGATPMAQYEDFTRRKHAAEKAGTTEGERVANAQMDLKPAVAQANEALRLVGELKAHKGRDNPVFFHSKSSAYLPDSAIPGNTDARDAVSILNQIKGGAFLEAFKALKGGGAITEVEGKKATDAIARMDRSQSRVEFDKALSDYEGIVKLGVDRANELAKQPAPNEFRGNAVKPGAYDWSPGGGLKQRGGQ